MADELVRRALAVNQALLALGNEVFEAEGATFVRNRGVPAIRDSNHVANVRARTPAEIDRLLARVEREYDGVPHRRFDLDLDTPPELEARLALEDYRSDEALVMLLEGELIGEAPSHEILLLVVGGDGGRRTGRGPVHAPGVPPSRAGDGAHPPERRRLPRPRRRAGRHRRRPDGYTEGALRSDGLPACGDQAELVEARRTSSRRPRKEPMMTPQLRWAAVGAMFGGVIWTVSWLLNVSLTDSSGEGTRLGFNEGQARAILNPAILLFLAGVWATYGSLERRLGRPGAGRAALIAAAGLVLLLVGNLMEFGLYGTSPIKSEDPGFAVFSLGLLVTLVGLALFAITGIRAKVLSGWETAAAVVLPLSIVPMATFGLGWFVWGYLVAKGSVRSRDTA